ncbi:hypothetical protein JTE90_000978 [Oedothorax gibbosus]|uniref:Uncharacterized protein n=1 Tax=Oedothorax gibbosus TaxID=931172 RepID=A0AAV6VBU6_9ARAC|nr:hypothetical protein JTE90_000978 [Oedothorax gibbosus]
MNTRLLLLSKLLKLLLTASPKLNTRDYAGPFQPNPSLMSGNPMHLSQPHQAVNLRESAGPSRPDPLLICSISDVREFTASLSASTTPVLKQAQCTSSWLPIPVVRELQCGSDTCTHDVSCHQAPAKMPLICTTKLRESYTKNADTAKGALQELSPILSKGTLANPQKDFNNAFIHISFWRIPYRKAFLRPKKGEEVNLRQETV